MTVYELIRRRVEVLRASQNQSPVHVVDHIIQTPAQKELLIANGPFLGITIDGLSLDEALNTYRAELLRVEAMEDGIFRERGMENGYTLSKNEDTCWGVYYNRLIRSGGRSEDDLDRVIDECNVIVQQFLSQPGQNPDRRGLVIGQVQSGKTTIFNGVISAAADMGFNIIIILSGTLESLRIQTQKRIAGDVTSPWVQRNSTPFYFTWISNHNGPGLSVAGRADLVLTDLSNPGRRQVAIGVFLKNASVLTNLRLFLNTINPADHPNIRALVIDDEADQATPNAGVNTNTITAINQGIKSLVIPGSGPFCAIQGRTSYLGFTATPFANLLNEAGNSTLYPRDFLYFLRSSYRYFGPWQLFGNPNEVEGEETIIPLQVIRILDNQDIDVTVPPTGRPRPPFNPVVTGGLRNAIRWYVLAAAMRRVRQLESWSTMLIHTSSRTNDHILLFDAVKAFCSDLLNDWTQNQNDWRSLWEQETSRVTLTRFAEAFPNYGSPTPEDYPNWDQTVDRIEGVIEDIKIKIDNSLYSGTERLVYNDDAPASERLQIAIGGNTLSRGLTLEGLVSSYFARRFTAQSGYDTLLQMGRWFGYRQGYELLCRLWTTYFLRNAFRDLVIMEANLRNTMQLYLQGHSPANKAPVITRMPAMALTRKSVLGNTVVVEADYSGTAPQTIMFQNDAQWLGKNLIHTHELLGNIRHYTSRKVGSGLAFENVPVNFILEFLEAFNFWQHSNTFNKNHMLQFIKLNIRVYMKWSVVVMGGRNGQEFIADPRVNMLNRSRIRGENEENGRPVSFINLKSLRATRELLCDHPELIPAQFKESDLWDIRAQMNLNPVLVIYPIDKDSRYGGIGTNTYERTDLNAKDHIIGLSLIMNPPRGQEGAKGVQLILEDAYGNDEDADLNIDMLDPR